MAGAPAGGFAEIAGVADDRVAATVAGVLTVFGNALGAGTEETSAEGAASEATAPCDATACEALAVGVVIDVVVSAGAEDAAANGVATEDGSAAATAPLLREPSHANVESASAAAASPPKSATRPMRAGGRTDATREIPPVVDEPFGCETGDATGAICVASKTSAPLASFVPLVRGTGIGVFEPAESNAFGSPGLSSWTSSPTDASRLSRSFTRHDSTAWMTCAGTSSRYFEMGSGVLSTTLNSSSIIVSAVNGTVPGEQLVEDDAERPDVGACVDVLRDARSCSGDM